MRQRRRRARARLTPHLRCRRSGGRRRGWGAGRAAPRRLAAAKCCRRRTAAKRYRHRSEAALCGRRAGASRLAPRPTPRQPAHLLAALSGVHALRPPPLQQRRRCLQLWRWHRRRPSMGRHRAAAPPMLLLRRRGRARQRPPATARLRTRGRHWGRSRGAQLGQHLRLRPASLPRGQRPQQQRPQPLRLRQFPQANVAAAPGVPQRLPSLTRAPHRLLLTLAAA